MDLYPFGRRSGLSGFLEVRVSGSLGFRIIFWGLGLFRIY
jgi:hypothetical protein